MRCGPAIPMFTTGRTALSALAVVGGAGVVFQSRPASKRCPNTMAVTRSDAAHPSNPNPITTNSLLSAPASILCKKPAPAVPAYTLKRDGSFVLRDKQGWQELTDSVIPKSSKLREFKKNHAIHDALHGAGKVESYSLFINKEREELVAVVKLGKSLNGYPGVVHGGILCLLIDDCYGMLFFNTGKPMSVTANLSLNFRDKVLAGSTVVLHCRVDKVDGRKLYMSGSIQDAKTGKHCVDSTTLFIAMKKIFDLPPWAEPLKPYLEWVVKILF